MAGNAVDFYDGNAPDYAATARQWPVNPRLAAFLARCKPGGRIVIVNHFAHPRPLINRFERLLADHAALLGFNAAMPTAAVTQAAGLRIHRVQPVNWGGYWTLIEAENIK